jgi:hypothetical protein
MNTTNGQHHATDADTEIDLLYAWHKPPQAQPTPTPAGFDNGMAGWPSDLAPTQVLPEAAFSLTLKGTLDGHDAMITIRGMSPAEFQRNLASVRGILDTAPSHAPATPILPPGDLPTCPEHGNFLRKGRRGFFCPQKVGEGYCKYTVTEKGGRP